MAMALLVTKAVNITVIFKPLPAIIAKHGFSIRDEVYCILEMSMNKIALWISVGVHDWTAKRAIIAGNVLYWKIQT